MHQKRRTEERINRYTGERTIEFVKDVPPSRTSQYCRVNNDGFWSEMAYIHQMDKD